LLKEFPSEPFNQESLEVAKKTSEICTVYTHPGMNTGYIFSC